MRAVQAGFCTIPQLKDGSLTMDDVFMMNDWCDFKDWCDVKLQAIMEQESK